MKRLSININSAYISIQFMYVVYLFEAMIIEQALDNGNSNHTIS